MKMVTSDTAQEVFEAFDEAYHEFADFDFRKLA